MSADERKVVPLVPDAEPLVPAPPPPHHGGHRLVVSLMALFALLGIAAMLALVTIGWTEQTGRYVTAIFVLSIVGFIACSALAVFTAARAAGAEASRRDGDARYH